MENFSKQFLTKPKHLKDKSLVALIGLYDQPVNGLDPMNPDYVMSQLAVNEALNLVQVYVEADNNGGLNKFKSNYPTHVIKPDGVLDNAENWEVLAFPSETMVDESTPLDNFYQARGKELVQIKQEERIKEKK